MSGSSSETPRESPAEVQQPSSLNIKSESRKASTDGARKNSRQELQDAISSGAKPDSLQPPPVGPSPSSDAKPASEQPPKQTGTASRTRKVTGKRRGSGSASSAASKNSQSLANGSLALVAPGIVAAEVGQLRENVNAIRVKWDGRKYPALDDPSRVALSTEHRAPQLKLSNEQRTVTGWKGFRTVRATHGVYEGTWYCEATVVHLGSTGHCRLGWCTRKVELQAPVGFDAFGFCYRDVEGLKITEGKREEYGEPFREGDVIGLWIHLPPGGDPLEPRFQDWIRFKGKWMQIEETEAQPKPLKGSAMGFARNGVSQGVAFRDFLEGTYYAAASVFTLPDQVEGASVTFNFGPHFQHPPPKVDGIPAARALCELAAPPPPPPKQQSVAELLSNVVIATGAAESLLGP